ncbi:hypothetical protein HF295_06885 [Hujiaoplasma nucleasis]|uniref:Helix-turn-helix domain-containing protein n=1 Tax=Hujiaoplasma nucleasis TaxID=2725268 RepID=A0A7L6N4U4_9MOLU|nr:hypothetical protein [Hujiaoplasma nucleasis]QLY40581.1 hypothetical protein HF295_06885 [Hujiaoplasma nucleasis]
MKVKDAAKVLGITPQGVHYLIKQGKLIYKEGHVSEESLKKIPRKQKRTRQAKTKDKHWHT